MRAVTFQAPGEVRVDEKPEPELLAPDDAIVRGRRQRHLRLGPPHLPRPGQARPRLHHRPRVRRRGRGGWRCRHASDRRRPRARHLLHRVRRLLLLRSRGVSQVRQRPRLRPRRDARLAAGRPGRAAARPPCEPWAPGRPGGALGRPRAVRRRRDGHRLPRDRFASTRRGRVRRGAGARPGRALRRAGRARRRSRERRRDRHRRRPPRHGRVLRRDARPPDRAGPAIRGQEADRRPRGRPRRRRRRSPRGARARLPPRAQGRHRLGHRRLHRAHRAAHGDRLDQGAHASRPATRT